MIRKIRTIGDPVLRKKAKKVEKLTKDHQKLIDDMIETMRASQGIGLAAPQVGISERIIVVEMEQDDDIPGSGVTYALVNPELSNFSTEKDDKAEGCLSIPGWAGEVNRSLRVTVKGMDRQGNRVKFEAEGAIARAFQHELDHLDGILYVDKLIAPDRVWRVEDKDKEKVA
jgi:peptide deformylase